MKKIKIPISIFTTKWGHFSIGKAIEDALAQTLKYKIHLNNIAIEKISELTYLPSYRLFPASFKLGFKASEQKYISKIIIKYLSGKYKKELTKLVKLQKPKVVINTYFGFNRVLEELSESFGFLYINVIADPRTLHKMSVSAKGYNFVFDKNARNTCIEYGVDKNKIIISGWFVQSSYRNNKKELNLKSKIITKDVLTILIVGGSAGSYSVLKALPAILLPKRPLQVILISGESKTLLRTAKLFSKLFSSEKLKVIAVGYTKNLHLYIRIADIVLGKAGPNLLFESVAAQKPFIAVSHIHGQEDGNLEIIKEYRLGIVEEDQQKLTKALKKIFEDPRSLHQFNIPLKKMAIYNQNSGKILLDFIESKLKD